MNFDYKLISYNSKYHTPRLISGHRNRREEDFSGHRNRKEEDKKSPTH